MAQLARDGGVPAFTGEFPRWPQWDLKEENNLLEALAAGEWGTLGTKVLAFTDRFSKYLGVRYAVAVNTGTQALEIMLRSAGIGRGDEVIVPPYTFVATVSAVAYVGAMPVFADVDADTGCLDANAVRSRITGRTKAILAVHVAGRPCDMDALAQVAREHNLLLLEDAAHAHGSEWKGRRCGALADAAAFSFQSSKALTGGEGGMVVTNNQDIYERCWQFHNSGRALSGGAELGGRTLMGTNARMAEWEAAILDAQMDRLDEQCKRRWENAKWLIEQISGLAGVEVKPVDERVTLWNGYIFQFRWEGKNMDRNTFVEALDAEGIPCSGGYPMLTNMGMFTEPGFEKSTGRRFDGDAKLPNAQRLAQTAVWIPGRVLLSERAAMQKVAEAIVKVANA